MAKKKTNFGLIKKTNSEDNQYNFGRLRAAKGLHMNLSKAQEARTIEKK